VISPQNASDLHSCLLHQPDAERFQGSIHLRLNQRFNFLK